MGVGERDRVAVALPNGQEMAVAFLAIAAGVTTEISRLDNVSQMAHEYNYHNIFFKELVLFMICAENLIYFVSLFRLKILKN
jgi:acyl-coenzyme A synthetase/AMP-(fatty) acid ligase